MRTAGATHSVRRTRAAQGLLLEARTGVRASLRPSEISCRNRRRFDSAVYRSLLEDRVDGHDFDAADVELVFPDQLVFVEDFFWFRRDVLDR